MVCWCPKSFHFEDCQFADIARKEELKVLKLFVVHSGDVYDYISFFVIANSEDEAMSLMRSSEMGKYHTPDFARALDVKLADNETVRIIEKHEDLY